MKAVLSSVPVHLNVGRCVSTFGPANGLGETAVGLLCSAGNATVKVSSTFAGSMFITDPSPEVTV